MAEMDLNQKWILVKGPTIRWNMHSRAMFQDLYVDVTVFRAEERNILPRPSEKIYELCSISVPSVNFFLKLPAIKIEHEELWAIDVLREKVLYLIFDGWYELRDLTLKQPLAYLVARIRNQRKTLKLPNGASLKGNLWHDRIVGHDYVVILGQIMQRGEEKTEVIYAFDMTHRMSESLRSGQADRMKNRHLLWCPKLAGLVIQYLRDFVQYTQSIPIQEYLAWLIKEIETSESWGKIITDIRENLLAVPVDLQGALISELYCVEEKLGLKLL